MTGITHRYGIGMASHAGEGRLVYRARIGLYVSPARQGVLLEQLGRALVDATTPIAPVDLVQLALTIDPRWASSGPPNLVKLATVL